MIEEAAAKVPAPPGGGSCCAPLRDAHGQGQSSAGAGCSTAITSRRCCLPSRADQVMSWPSQRPISAVPMGVRMDTLPAEMSASLGITRVTRSEEHTSELQSLMRISYAVFCLKKKKKKK